MVDKDDIRGKVKEAAGKVTGDDALERQGQTDQAKGQLKDAAGKVKDAAESAKDAITR
ncbi:MAG: CsbD-like [Frankiales bacterium]|nr:CsbD-like [Frankiales bacterium]